MTTAMPNKGYCDCSSDDPRMCGYCLAKVSDLHTSEEQFGGEFKGLDEPRVPRVQDAECTCSLTDFNHLCDFCRETLNRMTGVMPTVSWAFEESLPGFTEEDLTGGSSNYYELPVGAKEIADLIEHKNMSFNVGNIFKAAYRLGDKKGTTELYDIEKIIWFAQRELDRVTK